MAGAETKFVFFLRKCVVPLTGTGISLTETKHVSDKGKTCQPKLH
jgi:hypothetical protein